MAKANVLDPRSPQEPAWRIGAISNPWLLGATAATLALQLAAV